MRLFPSAWLILTAAALAVPTAFAAPASPDPLCQQEASVVQPIVLQHLYVPGHPGSVQKSAGMMVAVSLGDNVCYFGYGTTDLAARTPPTRNTIFEIGSVTKTFTGTMLALCQVRKRGSFHARDVVDTSHIPCVGPNLDVCLQLTNGMEALTYFELATFTGGLPDFPPNDSSGFSSDYNQQDFIEFLNAWQAPEGGLPAADVYSNSSYGLLGELLMSFDGYTGFAEQDTFESQYDKWIKHYISLPLGMGCTGVNVASLPQGCNAQEQLATGYFYRSACACYQSAQPLEWNPLGPSAGIRSTAADMAKYMNAYLGDKVVDGRDVPPALHWAMRIASARTSIALTKNPENRQAYSWVWRPAYPASGATVARPASFSKDGDVPGFSTCVFIVRGAQLGVTLMANNWFVPIGSQCAPTEAIVNAILALQ